MGKRGAASSFLIPMGAKPLQSGGLGALMRKRRAAPSFLIPLGGQPLQSGGLGALKPAA